MQTDLQAQTEALVAQSAPPCVWEVNPPSFYCRLVYTLPVQDNRMWGTADSQKQGNFVKIKAAVWTFLNLKVFVNKFFGGSCGFSLARFYRLE